MPYSGAGCRRGRGAGAGLSCSGYARRQGAELLLLILALYAPGALWLRLVAAGGTFVVLAALSILGRGALGGGDVKLMAVVGLWLGQEVVLALTTGFILGGVAAVVLLFLRRAGRKDFFAFGPFLIIGTLLGWLVQAVAW